MRSPIESKRDDELTNWSDQCHHNTTAVRVCVIFRIYLNFVAKNLAALMLNGIMRPKINYLPVASWRRRDLEKLCWLQSSKSHRRERAWCCWTSPELSCELMSKRASHHLRALNWWSWWCWLRATIDLVSWLAQKPTGARQNPKWGSQRSKW